jgi:hypothetical protein
MKFIEVPMAEKKKFDVVKHVRRLSRATSKVPKGQVVPAKKKKLLKQIEEKEARNAAR